MESVLIENQLEQTKQDNYPELMNKIIDMVLAEKAAFGSYIK